MLRAILFDFETDRGASLDLAQFGFDCMQKVLRFFFVDVEVAVSRHPEEVRSLDAHPVKQAPDMVQDDVPEKNVVVAVLLFRERNDPRQNARNLDDRDVGAQVFVAFEFDDHVEALVEKLRKRMGRIDRQGREHRVDALRKEIREDAPARLSARRDRCESGDVGLRVAAGVDRASTRIDRRPFAAPWR